MDAENLVARPMLVLREALAVGIMVTAQRLKFENTFVLETKSACRLSEQEWAA